MRGKKELYEMWERNESFVTELIICYKKVWYELSQSLGVAEENKDCSCCLWLLNKVSLQGSAFSQK